MVIRTLGGPALKARPWRDDNRISCCCLRARSGRRLPGFPQREWTMRIAPIKPVARIASYRLKSGPNGAWRVNAEQIGASVESVESLSALADEAWAAWGDQQAK